MGIETIIAVIIGLIAGGIINVLADDLPLRRSPRLPVYLSDEKKRAIHIPDENIEEILSKPDEARPPLAWLGITAFLFGLRTSPSGVRLSWRYPLTEILTMFFMVITVYALKNDTNLADVGLLQSVFFLFYMAVFALIMVIDIEHKLILFVVIIPSALLAIVDAFLGTYIFEDSFYQPTFRDALYGGVMGFMVFFLLYNGGFLFTYVMGMMRGERITEIAFGYGDVMMATLSGLILGWQALIFAMFITVFLGAFGAILFIISQRLLRNRYSAFTAIPYGPYIVIGTIMMLLYRVPVTDFLMRK